MMKRALSTPIDVSALSRAWMFLCSRWREILLVSALVLAPCFWHVRLVACDLGSHVYNAWLASLVEKGKAPGIVVVWQWNNVLFDYLLGGLARMVGLDLAEKLAVAVAVLLFFWSAFALVSAVAKRAAWRMVPCLMMLSYGWVFQMGFLNFYLSAGLSFLVLALFLRGQRKEWMVAAPMLVLIVLAHPVGAAWAVMVGAYVLVARGLAQRWQVLLPLASLVTTLGAEQYVKGHFRLVAPESNVYWMGGADQLITYGDRYVPVAVAVLLISGIFVVVEVIREGRPAIERMSVPLTLYVILGVAVLLAPGGFYLGTYSAPLGLLPDRASLFTAVLGCCVLGAVRLRRWQVAAFTVAALAYFALLYGDTGRANQMQAQVETLVAELRPGQRVLYTLEPENSRVGVRHIVDRACAGYCFSYSNYEPASLQFRVRALAGNGMVTEREQDAMAMQAGRYVVRAEDLPIRQIYFCGPEVTNLCMRELQAGEFNGRLDEYPQPSWE